MDPVSAGPPANGRARDERVAVVVGAGGGLGRATARALAAAGYSVAGVDRGEHGLRDLPDGVRRVVGDAADPAAARTLMDRIAAEAGAAEVLVNTIGTFSPGTALDATPQDLRVLMDVNLGAAPWPSQAVADIIVFLAGDLAAPVSGAIVPAYGP